MSKKMYIKGILNNDEYLRCPYCDSDSSRLTGSTHYEYEDGSVTTIRIFCHECKSGWYLALGDIDGKNVSINVIINEKERPNYREYIQSPEWHERAEAAKERAGHRCRLCNIKGSLHAHHRTYERLGKELPEDITVLCDDCHAKFHDIIP